MIRTGLLGVALAALMATQAMAQVPPEPAPLSDHPKMLQSDDPKLAANKKLVYDMYRTVLQAGHWDRAGEFIRDDYIQHNPNVVSGLEALQEYVRESRPKIEIEETLNLPLIWMMAEGDRVVLNFVRPRQDENGETYYTSWFDMFRIQDGKIAEHWDPAMRTSEMRRFDPNSTRIETDE